MAKEKKVEKEMQVSKNEAEDIISQDEIGEVIGHDENVSEESKRDKTKKTKPGISQILYLDDMDDDDE